MQREKLEIPALLPIPEGHSMHIRHAYKFAPSKYIHKMGGIYEVVGARRLHGTIAILLNTTTGEVVATGTAKVHKKDQPVKKYGRALAHNRCIRVWEVREMLADGG